MCAPAICIYKIPRMSRITVQDSCMCLHLLLQMHVHLIEKQISVNISFKSIKKIYIYTYMRNEIEIMFTTRTSIILVIVFNVHQLGRFLAVVYYTRLLPNHKNLLETYNLTSCLRIVLATEAIMELYT